MITLNMIVKDESLVISRCLNSVIDFIDKIVIIDTGSKDNTKDIISSICKSRDIDLELYDYEFTNFEDCRNYALSKVTNGYIFWIDADEILMGSKKQKLALKEYIKNSKKTSFNVLTKFGDIDYYRKQIVKANQFKWYGVLHEYIYSDADLQIGIINDLYTFVTTDGNSHKDCEKYLKHAKILEKEYNKTKEVRWKFYEAQSYENYGDIENAIRCYKERIELEGFWEEVYISKLRIFRLTKNNKPIIYSDDSCRIELLYEKVLYYFDIDKEYVHYLSIKIIDRYLSKKWQNCLLFLERPMYENVVNFCKLIFIENNNAIYLDKIKGL